jgi:hypothetical protein
VRLNNCRGTNFGNTVARGTTRAFALIRINQLKLNQLRFRRRASRASQTNDLRVIGPEPSTTLAANSARPRSSRPRHRCFASKRTSTAATRVTAALLLGHGPIGGCACLEVIPLSNVQNPKNSNRYHFALAGISRYKTAGQRMSLRSCLSGPKARWGAGEACSN